LPNLRSYTKHKKLIIPAIITGRISSSSVLYTEFTLLAWRKRCVKSWGGSFRKLEGSGPPDPPVVVPLLMRRFSSSLRLSTFRRTAFTCHSRQRSAMLPLTDYIVHVQRSASRWWCRSPRPSSGARSWFSYSPGLTSMVPITEMSCWWNKCCQQYDRSLGITLSSSRIARRRIIATPSSFSVAQRRSSSPQTCGRQTAQGPDSQKFLRFS